MKIDITEVRVSLREDAKLKAFASITLWDCFVIRGLKIIEGKTGTFVAMPSRRRKDGEYHDNAHPIKNDARAEMERIILDEYRKERERAKVTSDSSSHYSDRD
jgi:stage V sporulation protein G